MDTILQKFIKYKKYKVDKFTKIEMPFDFYTILKEKLSSADNVVIFSMYAGDNDRAAEILNIILKREKEGKRTKIILDKNRGLTKSLEAFIKKNNLKCFEFEDVSNTVNISRFKEISAVYHSKIYMFNDEIIVSGANLDNSYFTNRLDRYFLIKNKELADDIRLNNNNKLIDNELITGQTTLFKFGREDEGYILDKLLDYDFDSVHVSSAYFNLPTQYYKIFKKQKNVSFFVNDPKYNIFTNFGKFGSFITSVYEYSTYYTMKLLPLAKLYEFGVEGYSLHKKGVWAFKGDLCVTIIGSSNFNRRSYERDTELNFCVITRDPENFKMFEDEIKYLRSCSRETKVEDFKFGMWKWVYMILFLIFNRYF